MFKHGIFVNLRHNIYGSAYILSLTLALDQNEVVDLDVDLSLIPKGSRHVSNPQKDSPPYYMAEINVNFQIFRSVKVKLESGGIELEKYETNL